MANRVVLEYTDEYEKYNEYVVQVFDYFDSTFIRSLFFDSKQEALDFIKSN